MREESKYLSFILHTRYTLAYYVCSVQRDGNGVIEFDNYATGGGGGDEVRYIDGYSYPGAGSSVNFPVGQQLRRIYRFRYHLFDGEQTLYLLIAMYPPKQHRLEM